MGDLNNNSVTYDVNGVLIVDGTLQGKNNNVFQGTGTIAGGALDIKNGATCGTPCPITGNFDNCSSGTGGSAQVFCTSVLPVNLLYFTAVSKEDVVALNWATSMEENFSKFVVQRSHDGVVFEDIGEIPGKGFDIHNVQSKYDFIDEAPLLGFNYYRLKAVDIDESFQYFGVKAVKIRGGKRVAVYPNPLNGNIVSFRTNFSPSESDRVVLLNQLGGEVYNGMAGTNSILLQNKLRSGVYVLRYIAKDFEQVVRVVVHN
jgi:hypothetical protein